MNNTSVESYLSDGCGRCDLYQTPSCKVHRWTDELTRLRALLRDTELDETMKWGAPCYTLDGANVLMLSALKDSCVISFFKGAALQDAADLLEAPGPNSRYARYLRVRSIDDITARRRAIDELVHRAVAFERAGGTVDAEPVDNTIPTELADRLADDSVLAEAFAALTPGRQRSHILHISGARQAATRARRVDKCAPKILAGKGFNER